MTPIGRRPSKPESLVQFELYHLLRCAHVHVVPEVCLASRVHRSKYFYVDLALYASPVDTLPCALIECKRNSRQLGGRQRASYSDCGIPYFVAGADNLREAVQWALAQTRRVL